MLDLSRVLLLGGPSFAASVQTGVATWADRSPSVVQSIAEAAQRIRSGDSDVLVVDGQLPDLQGGIPHELLAPPCVLLVLAEQPPAPVAVEVGVVQWGPRGLMLAHPSVFQAGLLQAAELVSRSRMLAQSEQRLRESQSQMDHLLRLLGVGAPINSPRWHSQRTMLERLGEEVARVDRHGGNLSVVLAQVTGESEPASLAWIADQLTGRKRFCDVIGQYGPQGFMLLLPQTGETGARECYERLMQVLQAASANAGGVRPWRLDCGIASYRQPHTTLKGLLREAEEQLSRAQGLEP